MATTTHRYESIKVYDEDRGRAQAIHEDRGLPIIQAIGCALEGWDQLPRKVQDRIIRERLKRQRGSQSTAA